MLDLRHLRYFIAVASERSFTRAAEVLHMAQPPLSRQIQQIEEIIGATLIDRDKRPLELTPAGRLFHEQALQVVQRMVQLQKAMESFLAAERRRLNVGFVPSTIYARLPDIIRTFRAVAPDVDINLEEMTSLEQASALKEGRIDIGFGRIRVDDPVLEQMVLRLEPMVLAMPLRHPLAAGDRPISLAQLAGYPLIIYPRAPRPSYADMVLALLREHDVEPGEIREVKEVQTAIGLVAAESGLCLVPTSVQRLGRSDVVYRELVEEAASPITMNIRSGDRSTVLLTMAKVIAQVYRDWDWPVPAVLTEFIGPEPRPFTI
ncbi:MAG: LysR family transcriptional regulator [Candidatus Sphingomonas colombiensis]|nr:LysR family transcriptional regulator [Sphingomonas sp.]WEK41997.1 MAG: LysR family transcriptional regulator [Sphingomonas sp.]